MRFMNAKAEMLNLLGIYQVAMGLLALVHNPILGVFQVSLLYAAAYIISGVITLLLSFLSEKSVKRFCIDLGIFYAVLSLAGLFTMLLGFTNFMSLNVASITLNIFFSFVYICVGLTKSASKTDHFQIA